MTHPREQLRQLWPLLAIALVLLLLYLVTHLQQDSRVTTQPTKPGTYLLCLWNVENLFDDRNDRRRGPGDREFDPWMANNPDALKQKLGKLTEALLKLNGGRGPDILAAVEVEGVRAADLLRQALNEQLTDEKLHYRHVLMKELTAGRHIAPAIITRLPVAADRTRLIGKRMRTLEGHVQAGGHNLVLIVSHWTSRLDDGSEKRRAEYADKIHGAFRAMYENNPKVDVLICGDFNDTPDDDSLTKHLHATGDVRAVLNPGNGPLLLNLMAGKDPKRFGTHYYRGWHIFDQIVVSPGMLDAQGWSCDPESVRTVNTLVRPGDKLRRPWRFGAEGEKLPRGYSDHFPVTVELKAAE
jgi:endonuclease/exonuclease/phosphatase family metal-dependent hydrolase